MSTPFAWVWAGLAAIGAVAVALLVFPARVVVSVRYASEEPTARRELRIIARVELLGGLVTLKLAPRPRVVPQVVGKRGQRPRHRPVRFGALLSALRRTTSISNLVERGGLRVSPLLACAADQVAASVRFVGVTVSLGLGDAAATALAAGGALAVWSLLVPRLAAVLPSIPGTPGAVAARVVQAARSQNPTPLCRQAGVYLDVVPLFDAPERTVRVDATCILVARPGQIIVGALWCGGRRILRRRLRRELRARLAASRPA